MAGTSNKARGDANHRTLIAYFDRVGPGIPRKPDGSADISGIVNDAPLSNRQVIYQNDRNRTLCNERFAVHGIPPIREKGDVPTDTFQRPGAAPADEETRQLRSRVRQLEQELTVARGEVIELRRAMRRYEAIDIHLSETGRLPR